MIAILRHRVASDGDSRCSIVTLLETPREGFLIFCAAPVYLRVVAGWMRAGRPIARNMLALRTDRIGVRASLRSADAASARCSSLSSNRSSRARLSRPGARQIARRFAPLDAVGFPQPLLHKAHGPHAPMHWSRTGAVATVRPPVTAP